MAVYAGFISHVPHVRFKYSIKFSSRFPPAQFSVNATLGSFEIHFETFKKAKGYSHWTDKQNTEAERGYKSKTFDLHNSLQRVTKETLGTETLKEKKTCYKWSEDEKL